MQPHKIAIIGGIGSGKSVVSRLFRLMNIPVYDCDSEAKRLMNTSATLRSELIKAIDERVYKADGVIDRAYLASFMFGNAQHVALVNSIVHPAVRADFKQWAANTQASIVAVETAILFESGLDADVDSIVLVSAPIETRISRAILRDHSNEQAIRQRMKSQMSDTELVTRANHIILNDDTTSLIVQVEQVIQKIASK
jgi:dephospho-CoA kinase